MTSASPVLGTQDTTPSPPKPSGLMESLLSFIRNEWAGYMNHADFRAQVAVFVDEIDRAKEQTNE